MEMKKKMANLQFNESCSPTDGRGTSNRVFFYNIAYLMNNPDILDFCRHVHVAKYTVLMVVVVVN